MKYALAGVLNLLAILATIAGFVLAFVVDNGNFILLSMFVGLPAVLVTSFMVSATDGVPEEIACRQLHLLRQADDEVTRLSEVDRLLRQLDAQTADLQAALDDRPVSLKVSDRRAAGASVPQLFGVTTAEAAEILCRNMQAAFGIHGAAPEVPPGHEAVYVQDGGIRILNADGKDVTDWASCRPVDPIGPCPRSGCGAIAAHLLSAPEEVDGGRVVRRSCRSCTGSWRERLDA